jgi:YrbI family 3-deoxy-D-manno-octulosonate 8-phosphate phosphatase
MSGAETLPKRQDLDLLLFDFDGVMTDNRVLVFADGTEAVFCNRGDGLGLDMLRASDLQMAVVSTETNPVVEARAGKLKLPVYFGVADKGQLVRDLMRERGLDPSRVAFVGNDVNDLCAMKEVGWRLCPSDAHPLVKAVCHWVIPVAGGMGVVRHLAEALLVDGSLA